MSQSIEKNTPEDEAEFGIYTKITDFPLSERPVFIPESIGGVCISGTAVIQVFDTQFSIVPKMIVTLLPWQLVSVKEVSGDFRMTFFKLSPDMFTDTLSSLCRLRPSFFFYMSRHIAYEPLEGNIRRFLNYCDLLEYRMKYAPENCRRESIMQLLRVYYWDVYTVYINDPAKTTTRYTRKEEIACKFACMIVEEHSPGKDVRYYAERLDISPKYLTTLIKKLSGHSAHDWIVHYTILQIKSLLREPSIDLKTIASRVNFPDQPTLCRFFRRYTGMTASGYRECIHF